MPVSDLPPVFNVLIKLAGHQSDSTHDLRSDRLFCAHWPLLKKILFPMFLLVHLVTSSPEGEL